MQKVTFEELPELVNVLLEGQNEILSLLKDQPQVRNNPIGIEDVSKLILKSKPTIYRLVGNKQIPYHKNNGRLYFFRDEVIQWLKSSKTVSDQVDILLTQKRFGHEKK